MTTFRLTLDLDVDADLFGLDNPEERQCFLDALRTEEPGGELLLHSNYFGDTLGPVRLVAVEESPDET